MPLSAFLSDSVEGEKACRAETLPHCLRFWVHCALGALEMALLLSTSTAAHDAESYNIRHLDFS